MPAFVGTRRALAAAAQPPFTPYGIFAKGEDGFLFDFSKTDQLFQVASGQTPVAADTDPIGLSLDAHGWVGKTFAELIAAQSELFDDGALASSSGWTLGPWSVAGNTLSISGGNGSAFKVFSGLTIGRTYRVSFPAVKTSGTIRFLIRLANNTGTIVSSGVVTGDFSIYFVATATSHEFYLDTNGSAAVASINAPISVKEIPGNHDSQTTTTARPFWRTGGIKRPDGADDNHLTPFKAGGGGNSYVAKVSVPASIAASQVLAGLQGATNGRFFLGFNVSGQIIGGVGSDSTGVVTDAADRRGQTGVIALIASGATWRIYWNGSQVATGAQNGAVDITVPFRVDALNNNGTAASFSACDKKLELAVNRALSDAEISNLTNYWGTT